MKISVFGSGYVGLVTGACLAELGHEVLCIDIDTHKINNLKQGIIPIYEPGLEDLVKKNTLNERLQFTTDTKEGILFGKVIFSGVGTPPDKSNNNKADLTYVYSVAKTFGEYINEYKLFINKSTVPVGTGKACYDIIKREVYARNIAVDFDVVSNPEFLKEGSAIKDFLTPDRVVIGTESERAKALMDEVYKPLKKNSSELGFTDIIHTNIASAEIIKYGANAFLATKISFINEIANFCELTGGNIEDVALGIGSDRRIGKSFLNAGIGYGGSCFPKDILALIETGKEYDYNFSISEATHTVNESQKEIFFQKLKKLLGTFTGKKVCLWGVSFKANTDDIRNAASISLIEKLLATDIEEINLYDPIALENIKLLYEKEKRISYSKHQYEGLENADTLVLLTEWDEFKIPNFKLIKKSMRGNIILDGRNLWERKEIEDMEFVYECIGKK